MMNDYVFDLQYQLHHPLSEVWAAWTTADILKKWYGPASANVIHSQLDLRLEGSYHYGLKLNSGHEIYGLWVFKEITVPEKLVFLNYISDKKGTILTPAANKVWPKSIKHEISFTDKGSSTDFAIEATAYEATAAEKANFEKQALKMRQPWLSSFAKLANYLSEQEVL